MTVATKAKTIVELAKCFNLSKGTINLYLAEGMPGKGDDGLYDVQENLAWIRKNKVSKASGQLDNSGLAKSSRSEDRSEWTKWDWEREKLRLQCEKMVFEFDELRGKYISREEIVEELKKIRGAEKQALYAIGPQVASFFGDMGPQIEQKINDAITGILGRLHSGKFYSNGDHP